MKQCGPGLVAEDDRGSSSSMRLTALKKRCSSVAGPRDSNDAVTQTHHVTGRHCGTQRSASNARLECHPHPDGTLTREREDSGGGGLRGREPWIHEGTLDRHGSRARGSSTGPVRSGPLTPPARPLQTRFHPRTGCSRAACRPQAAANSGVKARGASPSRRRREEPACGRVRHAPSGRCRRRR